MAESRDRITRAIDIAEVFARRRSGPLGIVSDEAQELLGSPGQQAVMRRPMAVSVTTSTAHGGGIRRDSIFRTPRSGIRRGRNLYRSTAPGRENAPATESTVGRGRGRATDSVLPSWYPRTPLRNITAVARAIERRRARLGDGESLIVESPISQDERVLNSNVSSGTQLEHNFSTPASTSRLKPCPPSVRNVSKILLNVTNQNAEESELLTPQKKLLNSIDIVEEAVMEELQKMTRTPSAKKAERQKKVRTLMSMR
ncbi:protein POLYCHOME-like [Durio zibethinus]|uniref:Protein POLYCHOME-like n=1 Tax=Durio zibethinus TaxID=66656 RepID=A0A6P5Z4K9_DURZI|nr:protein POLYCHOME-like [Durio zibethinus]